MQVLEFLGIGEGDKVMDVIASGGYYTEVLAEAVGPDGLVYALADRSRLIRLEPKYGSQ